MRRNRLGKIVATVGPASNTPEMLEKLYLSGVDVFRLNCSHGSHDDKRAVYNAIRALGDKYGYNPTILVDLQGPKLRVGAFANGKEILNNGDLFRFDLDRTPGDNTRVCLPHPEILQALKPGATLSVDDGKIKLEVVECSTEHAVVKVIVGGTISNNKGVNVPDVILPIPALTKKDLEDLEFALELGVDWVALSFVQKVEDVLEAKKIINGRAKICSKIEKPSAVEDIENIVEESDAIMVARGDLAVEVSPEMVPVIQRTIVDLCHHLGRPVIVATQMLESMITTPTPTRAEASDVATAVYMGADATMLSAESAAGSFPTEAVSMMSTIIENIEEDPRLFEMIEQDAQIPECDTIDAFSVAVDKISSISDCMTIVMFSNDLESVTRLSRTRPCAPVLLATTSKEVASTAGLIWGVTAVRIDHVSNLNDMVVKAKELAVKHKLAIENDIIVVYSDTENPVITSAII